MKLSKETRPIGRSVAAYGMRCNSPVLRHFFHSTLPLCCIRTRGLPLQRVVAALIFFSVRIEDLFALSFFFQSFLAANFVILFSFDSRNLNASLERDRMKLIGSNVSLMMGEWSLKFYGIEDRFHWIRQWVNTVSNVWNEFISSEFSWRNLSPPLPPFIYRYFLLRNLFSLGNLLDRNEWFNTISSPSAGWFLYFLETRKKNMNHLH